MLFYFVIFVRKVFSCSKRMMLNNFVIDFFPIPYTAFEIKTLTQNFAARWRCKGFHCVARGHFTIHRYHFYDYSSFRSEIIGVATDFGRYTVLSHSADNAYLSFYICNSYVICIFLSLCAMASLYITKSLSYLPLAKLVLLHLSLCHVKYSFLSQLFPM